MAVFFIDTQDGRVATQKQLMAAGIASQDGEAPGPWHRIQGTHDATTLWYAVMRRREKGIFIGSLVFRHSPHHALLVERGWEDVHPDAIGVDAPAPGGDAAGDGGAQAM
jgi:hypothetical protein